jgi:hypothetical protein
VRLGVGLADPDLEADAAPELLGDPLRLARATLAETVADRVSVRVASTAPDASYDVATSVPGDATMPRHAATPKAEMFCTPCDAPLMKISADAATAKTTTSASGVPAAKFHDAGSVKI